MIEDSSHRGIAAVAMRSLRRCNSVPLLALPPPLPIPSDFLLQYPSDLEAWSAVVDAVRQQQWHLWPSSEAAPEVHGRWALECPPSHWIWNVTDLLQSLEIQDVEIPYLHPQEGLLQCS